MQQVEADNISALFKKPMPVNPAMNLKKPATPSNLPSGLALSPAPERKYALDNNSAARSPKPEAAKSVKKDFGIIDFSKHDVLHGVSNTKNTRYQLDKQLRGVFNSATERSAIAKELGNQISSGGTLTKYGTKKVLRNLRNAGKLTQGQVNRTLSHLGI